LAGQARLLRQNLAAIALSPGGPVAIEPPTAAVFRAKNIVLSSLPVTVTGDIITTFMARVPQFLDISVPLAAGTPTYPGNPAFEMQSIKRIAEGASSNVSRLVMGTHTGTHVDAPRHFFDDGPGADTLALEMLIGRARVIDLERRGGITAEDLSAAGLREDLRVLLRTRNSALWNGAAFSQDYTHLTESGARYLVDQGVKLVGIDYLSVEQFKKAGAPAHRTLLSQGVIIIEGLNLSEVEPGMYELYCLPLRVAESDGAPARVVLKR
jgi:arylformamidase